MKKILGFKITLFIAISFSLIYFILGFIVLSDYGVNWDEERHNFRGQAYINYILTGNKDYENLYSFRRSYYQTDKIFTIPQFLYEDPICCHPPVNDLLSSFFNMIFYQKLGVVGDTDSYHIAIILASSILVGVMFYVTATEIGMFAGIIAALSLLLNPLFFSESHFNFKDPIETSFYALTLLSFYLGITRKSWKWMILSAVLAGFALGTKFNILFASISVFLWMTLYKWKKIISFEWFLPKGVTISIIIYLPIAFSVLYFSWPFLWQNTLSNIGNVINYYFLWGYGIKFQPEKYYTFFGLNSYPAQWIIYTTPLVILFFSLIGIFHALKQGKNVKNKFTLFVLLWLIVPIIRVTLPRAGIVNGMRESMEYIPALAILSGIGAHYLISSVNLMIINCSKFPNRFKKKSLLILQLLIILSFVPILLKLISIHPNENVYFNPLIGGLNGAKTKEFWFWGNSFGNTYRQAANWLNNNAEKNAKIVLAMGYEANMPRVWLRSDLNYSNIFRKNYFNNNGEYIVEMTGDEPVWPNFCYWLYVRKFLKPVYEIRVDGVVIMAIWKNDRNHLGMDITEESKSTILKGCTERNEFN